MDQRMEIDHFCIPSIRLEPACISTPLRVGWLVCRRVISEYGVQIESLSIFTIKTIFNFYAERVANQSFDNDKENALTGFKQQESTLHF